MPEGTENFEFENSSGFEKSVKKFRNSLKNLKDSNNSFFDSIIYGLMYNQIEGKCKKQWTESDNSLKVPEAAYRGLIEKQIDKEMVKEILGENMQKDLLEIKDDIQLDDIHIHH